MIRAMADARRGPEEESAHDVLAAEAFAVPAPDPVLRHHDPIRLPADPTGIPQAHDILAAEEFAMPAPRPGAPGYRRALATTPGPLPRALAAAVTGAFAALLLRRRRG